MDLQRLTKTELMELLESKELVASSLQTQKAARLTPEQVQSAAQLRCRLCVSERYEEPDPNNPVNKVLKWRGQPIAMQIDSDGNVTAGREPPCRTCRHIRALLKECGYMNVYV